MTAPAFLLAYAAVLGTIAGPILRRAAWPERAPRLGIATWQALSASVVVALVLGGLTLAVPAETLGEELAHLVAACVHMLHPGYAEPQQSGLATFALVAALVTVLRIAQCLGSEIIRTSRLRRRLADALAIVGSHRPDLGVTLVQGDSPMLYCLPGRSKQVVLTTGALTVLTADQLRAALAHERSHLNGHHHLVIAAAAALARAIPVLPLFALAHDEVCRLIEMLADDDAGRTHRCGPRSQAHCSQATARSAAHDCRHGRGGFAPGDTNRHGHRSCIGGGAVFVLRPSRCATEDCATSLACRRWKLWCADDLLARPLGRSNGREHSARPAPSRPPSASLAGAGPLAGPGGAGDGK